MRSYLRRSCSAQPLLLALAVLGPVSPAQQTRASITVTVVDAAGVPQPSVQVTVFGTTLGAMTNNAGVAVLRAVPPGRQSLVARSHPLPTCSRRDVVVPSGGTLAVTIQCADVVDAVNAPASSLIGVLDHATDATGTLLCADDATVEGTGRLVIPGNAALTDGSGTACHAAALILARDRAPLYVNAALPWTPTLGDVYPVVMPTAKLRVPIRIFISDPSLTAEQKESVENRIRDVHLAHAATVLDESFAGIELVDDEATGGDPQIIFNESVATILEGGCLASAQIRADASIYMDGRINVYYVKKVVSEDGGEKAGYVCTTSDAPNIIFIDDLQNAPYTLTHELGHALGSTRPDWGHSQFYAGMYQDSDGKKTNVMAETDELPNGSRYFSVGQVARMHLGDESWLNRPSAADGSTVRTRQAIATAPTVVTACGCPETGRTPDCAALNTDISRPGTKQPGIPTFKMACKVVPSVPTVSVCAQKETTTDASFFTHEDVATISGSSMWVSLNPAVLSAALESKTANKTQGRLKGVSAGTATVRAYVDGSYATVTVTVTPPC